MTVGYLIPGLAYSEPGIDLHGTYAATVFRAADAWDNGQSIKSGVQSGTGKISAEAANTHSGAMLDSTFGSLYDRIIIEPGIIDVGNLTSNVEQVVNVWNGFGYSKSISSYSEKNTTGIAVSQPVALPYAMKPYEQLGYTVAISTIGPASINAGLDFVIDGATYAVSLIGSRTVLLTARPERTNPLTETFEWKTDIQRSFDGSEQRIALRTKPRLQYDYSFSEFYGKAQDLQMQLLGWANRLFAVPVWTDGVKLTADLGIGSLSVPIDPTNRAFTIGDNLIFFKDSDTYEVRQIGNIANPIGLTRPTEKFWPAGTRVYPVVLGRVPQSFPMQLITGGVVQGQATVYCSPVDTAPNLPTAAAPTSFAGYELVLMAPNWSNALSATSEADYDLNDNQTGSWTIGTRSSFQNATRQFSFMLRTRQEIADFKALLLRLRGRAKPVYMPTWAADFTLVAQVAATAGSIKVATNGYTHLLGESSIYNHILVRTRSGGLYPRTVIQTSDNGDGTSTLGMGSPLGETVNPGDIKGIHLLMLSRLAGDQVAIVWHTDTVATCDLTFYAVKA